MSFDLRYTGIAATGIDRINGDLGHLVTIAGAGLQDHFGIIGRPRAGVQPTHHFCGRRVARGLAGKPGHLLIG
ncbi:hypothetical protein A2T76_07425 [Pseudomonas brenneri]|nr:hypothetical protein A2T76_07425 [Pseudomonas brenneri]